MRLALVTDGTHSGTYLADARTGERLEGVLEARWTIEDGHDPVLDLRIVGIVMLPAPQVELDRRQAERETPAVLVRRVIERE